MSESMYRRQVERLANEIADLRKKLAVENKRVADDRSKANRAAQAMTRTSSASTARSKAREVERYEKSAAAHEQKASTIGGQIASKARALNTAQSNLDRAVQQRLKNEEREADRRRMVERDHLRNVERAQRLLETWPEEIHARPSMPPPQPPRTAAPQFTEQFDVCLSFAGEQRPYVAQVAEGLKAGGLNVFYDQDEAIAAQLWGRDLTEYLDYVYRQASRFCVMFISVEYAAKEWTRLERRSALDRAMGDDGEYILPARFDNTELPGLRPSVGYVNLGGVEPPELVEFIRRKLDAAA
jgi:TIR domain